MFINVNGTRKTETMEKIKSKKPKFDKKEIEKIRGMKQKKINDNELIKK